MSNQMGACMGEVCGVQWKRERSRLCGVSGKGSVRKSRAREKSGGGCGDEVETFGEGGDVCRCKFGVG